MWKYIQSKEFIQSAKTRILIATGHSSINTVSGLLQAHTWLIHVLPYSLHSMYENWQKENSLAVGSP